MSKIDEAKARIEATRAIKIEACPRCGRDNCGCYASGEFWEMQRQLRARDHRIAELERERDQARQRVKVLERGLHGAILAAWDGPIEPVGTNCAESYTQWRKRMELEARAALAPPRDDTPTADDEARAERK